MLFAGTPRLTPGALLNADWQISAGDLSELARPALFALAALSSAWVFHDARGRAGFGKSSAWAWALLTLLFPPAVLPLYLGARLFTLRAAAEQSSSTESAAAVEAEKGETKSSAGEGDAPLKVGRENEAGEDCDTKTRGHQRGSEGPFGVSVSAGPPPPPDRSSSSGGGEAVEPAGSTRAGATHALARLAPSLFYAAALLLIGAVYFYADYRSFDAHLARAERAKLYRRGESASEEYRAALGVREDAHTRKLLGLELLRAGRAEEALAELRAAGRGGEPDESITFHVATALDALGRRPEAADAYRQFLRVRACAQPGADARCDAAGARLAALEAPAR